ncbi:hypothetical protein VTL71DRAFT_13992 [Oculimacula yallundae]|uniref:Ubiquitin-like domain-containing protein n=1 Tax=Oculimacula yallundae TaxID=86028 RepID=A0ABR4CP19_9HELO
MEPLSAAASIIGVVHIIGQVVSAATTFMQNVRCARKEIVSVKKELSSLKVILEILVEDFKDPANTDLPVNSSVVKETNSVALSCGVIVKQIGELMKVRSSITWAVSGKAELAKLQASLEVLKSTLSVTLDLVSVIILKDIKSDTEQILQDTTTLKQGTSQMQNDISQILAKISQLQDEVHNAKSGNGPSDYMLERYLNNLKTDAETVVDESEYQDGHSDYSEDTYSDGHINHEQQGGFLVELPEENIGLQTKNSFEETPLPGREEAQNLAPITFTNSQGRKTSIPYHLGNTWMNMSEWIRKSYDGDTKAKEMGNLTDLNDNKYRLIGPNNEVILPSLWDQLVQPGWEVSLKLREEPRAENKKPIRFKDAVGRKFSFPFDLCHTWEGMQELINGAFLNVDVIGPYVREGHYDLVGPNEEIILPGVWATMIEPDWAVTMHMWPISEPPSLSSKSGHGPRPARNTTRERHARPVINAS